MRRLAVILARAAIARIAVQMNPARISLALVAFVVVATGGWSSATAGSIYAGPKTDPVFAVLGAKLSLAMFPNQRFDLVPLPDSMSALARVAEEPGSVAIADLATTLDYARQKGLSADRLEFHTLGSSRCLIGFTRRGGWMRGFTDLLTAGNTPNPVIGITDSTAETALGMLRALEPGLGSVQSVSAEMPELVARTAGGTVDLMLVVVNPNFDQARLEALADDKRLARVPVVTRLLSRAAAAPGSGFTMAPLRTDSGLLPWSRAPDVTLCTPIGAVLTNDAPPLLRDTLNRAAPVVAASLRTSLTDLTMNAAQSALVDVISSLKGLLDRF